MIADALSQIETTEFPKTVDYVKIAWVQANDSELQALMNDVKKFHLQHVLFLVPALN